MNSRASFRQGLREKIWPLVPSVNLTFNNSKFCSTSDSTYKNFYATNKSTQNLIELIFYSVGFLFSHLLHNHNARQMQAALKTVKKITIAQCRFITNYIVNRRDEQIFSIKRNVCVFFFFYFESPTLKVFFAKLTLN